MPDIRNYLKEKLKKILQYILAIITVILISVTFPGCFEGPTPTQWPVYYPADSSFSIRFPGIPQVAKQTFETLYGPIDIHFIALDTHLDRYRSNIAYFLTVSEMPEEMLADTVAFFEDRLNNYMDTNPQVKKKILSNDWTNYKGNTGLEARILETESKITSTVRWILVNNTLYSLSVGTEQGKENNPDIEKFLNSLITQNK